MTTCFITGALVTSCSLLTTPVTADTSTTSVSTQAPKFIDKVTASYWGADYGPSISNPDARTNDTTDGTMSDVQNLDSTLSAGYKLTDSLTLAGHYRFVIQPLLTDKVPVATDHYFVKDPWVSLKISKLVSRGNLNVSGDLRVYLPIAPGSIAFYTTAICSTQVATYQIAKTRLTLGTYTIERANVVKETRTMESFNLFLAPFGSYQLSQTVAATAWSDLLQYDIHVGQALINRMVDLSVGANWDVTSNFSVNPQLTVFPGSVTLDKTTIGAIISAKFL